MNRIIFRTWSSLSSDRRSAPLFSIFGRRISLSTLINSLTSDDCDGACDDCDCDCDATAGEDLPLPLTLTRPRENTTDARHRRTNISAMSAMNTPASTDVRSNAPSISTAVTSVGERSVYAAEPRRLGSPYDELLVALSLPPPLLAPLDLCGDDGDAPLLVGVRLTGTPSVCAGEPRPINDFGASGSAGCTSTTDPVLLPPLPDVEALSMLAASVAPLPAPAALSIAVAFTSSVPFTAPAARGRVEALSAARLALTNLVFVAAKVFAAVAEGAVYVPVRVKGAVFLLQPREDIVGVAVQLNTLQRAAAGVSVGDDVPLHRVPIGAVPRLAAASLAVDVATARPPSQAVVLNRAAVGTCRFGEVAVRLFVADPALFVCLYVCLFV